MIVGFTGSRRGMTSAQTVVVAKLLTRPGITEFHHGDCVGADREAQGIATLAGLRTVGHPPLIATSRAFCENDDTLPPLEYLTRNQQIAEACDVLIACPGSAGARSGTAATIRYALKAGKPCIVVDQFGHIANRTKENSSLIADVEDVLNEPTRKRRTPQLGLFDPRPEKKKERPYESELVMWGRKLASNTNWAWLAGMKGICPGQMGSGRFLGITGIDGKPNWHLFSPSWHVSDLIPDLMDFATLGCIEWMLREAAKPEGLTVSSGDDASFYTVALLTRSGRPKQIGFADTSRGVALASALCEVWTGQTL